MQSSDHTSKIKHLSNMQRSVSHGDVAGRVGRRRRGSREAGRQPERAEGLKQLGTAKRAEGWCLQQARLQAKCQS